MLQEHKMNIEPSSENTGEPIKVWAAGTFLASFIRSFPRFFEQLGIRTAPQDLKSSARELAENTANIHDRELQFASNVAHELRGPITVIQNVVSDSLRIGNFDFQQSQTLIAISTQLELMKNTLEKLLLLARAGAGQLSVSRQRVDLSAYLNEYCAEFESLSDKVKIKIEIADGLNFRIDTELFQSLFFNLMNNALKYNIVDGWINVRAWQQPGSLTIKISNSTNEDLAACQAGMMNRFFRGPVARVGDSEGSGLGIHIAREIATAHNGQLNFDFSQNKVFSVEFHAHDETGD